jgi:hypothetical protein
MKTLRLVLAAAALLAACDAPDPSAPERPTHSGAINSPTPENSPPCDSSCKRSPMMGGGGS